MSERSARAHLSRYPDRLHDLFWRRALPGGRLGMAPDAIRALGPVCYSNGDQLLGLARQRAVLKDCLAKLLERGVDLWCERAAPHCLRLVRFRIKGLGHGVSFLVSQATRRQSATGSSAFAAAQ